MKDLEVLLGAEQLVVVVSCFLLCLQDLILLGLDDLLQLCFLAHHKFQVVFGAVHLCLETVDCCAGALGFSLVADVLALELLELFFNLVFLASKSPDLIALIRLLLSRPRQLILELLNPRLVQIQLLTHASRVIGQLVDSAGRQLNISLQVCTSSLIQIDLLLHLEQFIILAIDILFLPLYSFVVFSVLPFENFHFLVACLAVRLEGALVLGLLLDFVPETTVFLLQVLESSFSLCHDILQLRFFGLGYHLTGTCLVILALLHLIKHVTQLLIIFAQVFDIELHFTDVVSEVNVAGNTQDLRDIIHLMS